MQIKKAVIPAAGLGTRFLPATKAQPKEMLPIVDTPAIHYVVKEAIESGIEDILIITGKDKTAIENYFDRSIELECLLNERQGKEELLSMIQDIAHLADIHYIRQKEPLGLGHAVLRAKQHVGDQPFAVLLGDDLFQSETPVLSQMIANYEQRRAPVIALEKVPKSEIHRYGVVKVSSSEGKLHRLADLVEKPAQEEAPSDLAVIGRYILPPDIFQILEETTPGRGGEIQLTDALRVLNRSMPMYGYQVDARRFDVGDKLGFLQATVEFALARPDLGRTFEEYLRRLIDARQPSSRLEAAVSTAEQSNGKNIGGR